MRWLIPVLFNDALSRVDVIYRRKRGRGDHEGQWFEDKRSLPTSRNYPGVLWRDWGKPW